MSLLLKQEQTSADGLIKTNQRQIIFLTSLADTCSYFKQKLTSLFSENKTLYQFPVNVSWFKNV